MIESTQHNIFLSYKWSSQKSNVDEKKKSENVRISAVHYDCEGLATMNAGPVLVVDRNRYISFDGQ